MLLKVFNKFSFFLRYYMKSVTNGKKSIFHLLFFGIYFTNVHLPFQNVNQGLSHVEYHLAHTGCINHLVSYQLQSYPHGGNVLDSKCEKHVSRTLPRISGGETTPSLIFSTTSCCSEQTLRGLLGVFLVHVVLLTLNWDTELTKPFFLSSIGIACP